MQNIYLVPRTRHIENKTKWYIYNKVEVYALIFGHILFNSTLDWKTALSQPILYSVIKQAIYFVWKTNRMVGLVDIIGEFIFLLNNRYTSYIIQRFDYFHQSGKRYN